jgi:hypothetical protein
MPLADYLNLSAMCASLFGVFLLPAVGYVDLHFAQMAFGLVALLFVGHAVALAGHYDLLFHRGRCRSFIYCTRQEMVVVTGFVLLGTGYVLLWARRDWSLLTAMFSG